MFDRAEIDRIDRGEGISTPLPTAFWEFELDLGDHPERTLATIREVVRKIATRSDDTWPSSLPNWLADFMPEISKDEAERLMAETPREKWNTLPWTFGSWLDAMRERAWKWWGYETAGRKAKLVLEVTSIPPRIEAFKQILLAARVTILGDRPN